jgi:hypothetical protein
MRNRTLVLACVLAAAALGAEGRIAKWTFAFWLANALFGQRGNLT